MKLSTTVLYSILSVVTLAAPIEEVKRDAFDLPEDAVLGELPIDEVMQPLFAQADGEDYIIVVNSTLLETEFSKRDADADAGWGFNYRGKYQPISKRDADADADADAGWGFNYRGKYQPISKRDADADADAGWGFNYRGKYQPISKRDADADADAGWGFNYRGKYQPIS